MSYISKTILGIVIIFSHFLFGSCKKTETLDVQQSEKSKVYTLDIPGIRDNGFSSFPLTDNGDGSYSTTLWGAVVRFSNFMYEIPVDNITGQQFLPPTGHPAWPSSIGPDPDGISEDDFYCLDITPIPNDIDYTLVVIPACKFLGTIYIRGAGTKEYQDKVAEAESYYDLQMQAYLLTYQAEAARRFTNYVTNGDPYVPQTFNPPMYIPFPLVDGWNLIKKDFTILPSSNPFALVKFTVINENGIISYKMDVKG